MKNYYEILEVNPKASKEVMEKAYKVLVKKYHPDLYEGQERIYAEQKLRDINEAYKILTDDFLREQYNLELEKEMQYNIDYGQRENEVEQDNVYKRQKRAKKSEEQESTSRPHKVGTFMSLVDLSKTIFKNVPKNGIKNIKREDLIAAGLTVLMIIVLGVILWFIPATNGFIRSIIPFV